MTESDMLAKTYDPRSVEPEVYALWERIGAFRSHPADPPTPHEKTFTIVMPPPNVTGALHLGHALNNTLQDILIRYHRMRGFNTLWQPGTDHAGIATQAVVERRIREQEGKTRHELGREELVRRIWQWKDDYEKRIISQLKLMGCSCDWERTRFTLDEGLARAVREMFFRLFRDGLIFRGKRLVNWDTQLQTAVSDDEVYHETVKGHFWHFKYPVIHDQRRDHEGAGDEPAFVIIATTRPETMLGDTAVAVHPDPAGFLDREEAKLRELLATATARDRTDIDARLAAISQRRQSHLPQLLQLRDMARTGGKLLLPLVEREIPLIADEWANPMLGSGCVKITPAHDANDYEVGVHHNLPMINVLTPDGKVARIIETDGSVNPHSARYEGLPFNNEARARVVADLESGGLLESVEDRDIEIGHSDRSKLPIEPFLSDQWFLTTKGTEANANAETPKHRNAEMVNGKGLAHAAMDVVHDGRIQVFPSRYAKTYLDWLGEKRDWCISRQLWWGHRIPIWHKQVPLTEKNWTTHILGAGLDSLVPGNLGGNDDEACVRFCRADTGRPVNPYQDLYPVVRESEGEYDILICALRDSEGRYFEKEGYKHDPDVLDTWFSSALWPFSTLGWPEKSPHVRQYYPGSVLCTSRDIITNWVARMVMFGLYAMGEVPFDHVYIHPKILDGRGETMSKSKGNGVDPVDIIHTSGADALRYTLADMTTETQDIRMPVNYVCPHCGQLTEQGIALKNEEQRRKSRGEKLERKLQPADCGRVTCTHKDCGKEFATQWADADTKQQLGLGRETSEKFEIGRNFCNKLWNAARFAFMNLEGTPCERINVRDLPPEDRWVLARLSQTVRRYHECLKNYHFAASVKELREYFWDCLCDWYLELSKPRLSEPRASARAEAQQVLAFCLDQSLRLWHPTIPFITERLWPQLNGLAPRRGFPGAVELRTDGPLILAEFPPVDGYAAFDDDGILRIFGDLQDATRGVRELRTSCKVPPKQKVNVTVVVAPRNADSLRSNAHVLSHMAGIDDLQILSQARRPPNAGSMTVGKLRIYVHDISNDAEELTRTRKSLDALGKQIAGKEAKLSNAQFVAHADGEVVQAERERLRELQDQSRTLQEHLAELGV